jgi:capsular exopolysaccharide synthesis family protein
MGRLVPALKKGWLLIVLCTIASGAVAAFYVMRQPKIYKATATIKIDPSPARPLGDAVQVDMGSQYWLTSQYYETQYGIIKSRRVSEATVRRLGLDKDPTFASFEAPVTRAEPLPVEKAALILVGRISLTPVRESSILQISYEDGDKVRAQRVLATLIDAYIEQNLQHALLSTNSASDWLGDQLDKLKQELEGSELELHKYKKDKQLLSVSLTDQSNMLMEEMRKLAVELTGVKVQRERLLARYEQLSQVSVDDPANLAVEELLTSSVLQGLRERYLDAKTQTEALIANGKGVNHPDVKALQPGLEASREALIAEIKNIQGAAQADLRAVEQELAGLTALNQQAKQRAMDLNINEIEYKRLERTKENTEKLYSLVLEKAKASDLSGQMRFNNVQMVDSPLLPGGPVRPRVPFTIALGALGGLLLGGVLAFGRESMDTSVKSPEDLEAEAGVSFLGIVPQVSLESGSLAPKPQHRGRGRRKQASGTISNPELVAHDYPKSGFSEALRAVRTNLQFMSPDKPFRRLLITSAGPAEGKTTVACGLAVALAQAGQRVLLIDCDLRRPRLHRIFDASNDFGVSTALLEPDQLDLKSLESSVPNLSVLPSGPPAPNPAELLQSERFAGLLQKLGQHYDRIVLDSPPVMPVTDAAILSTMVDGTVVVVRAFATSRHLLSQAVRALTDVGASVAGGVLNGVDLHKHNYGRYQYYYYRREYTDESRHSTPPSA